MKLPELFELDFDEESEEEIPPSPQALHHGRLLAGAIGMACTVLIDDLFDDIVALGKVKGPLVLPAGLRAFHELPPAYVEHYDPAFLRRFLTVAVDLSRQVLGDWVGLTCVAQELAMRLVLNRVGVIAEQWSLELDPDWFGIATEQLYWDIDHEFLYRGGYLSREKAGLVEAGRDRTCTRSTGSSRSTTRGSSTSTQTRCSTVPWSREREAGTLSVALRRSDRDDRSRSRPSVAWARPGRGDDHRREAPHVRAPVRHR